MRERDDREHMCPKCPTCRGRMPPLMQSNKEQVTCDQRGCRNSVPPEQER